MSLAMDSVASYSTWEQWARPEIDVEMPSTFFYVMWGIPFAVLVLMIVWLRVLWPSPPKPDPDAKKDPLAAKVFGAGDAVEGQAIPYTDPFGGFDLAFPIGWVSFLIVLIGLTNYFQPEVFSMAEGINVGVKFCVMFSSSIVGGLCARAFTHVDERGYVRTNEKGKTMAKNSWFKVNYTRKIQHFAAYAVPVLIPSPFKEETWVTVCWGDMATLLGFLITIKPIREFHAFFMMQFNSYDRPEDRPFTLKWIVLGDIVPGMVVLALFYILYFPYMPNGMPATKLLYIAVMTAGLGDGLAEPVGVTWGTHKYEVGALCAGEHVRKYQRSIEGSCCVCWWTYIFVIQRWQYFVNATAFWISMIALPPLMAWSEARSPHTMDTPFIFIVGGIWTWAMLYMPAIPFLEP